MALRIAPILLERRERLPLVQLERVQLKVAQKCLIVPSCGDEMGSNSTEFKTVSRAGKKWSEIALLPANCKGEEALGRISIHLSSTHVELVVQLQGPTCKWETKRRDSFDLSFVFKLVAKEVLLIPFDEAYALWFLFLFFCDAIFLYGLPYSIINNSLYSRS